MNPTGKMQLAGSLVESLVIKEVDACPGWTWNEHGQGVVAVNVIGRTLDVTGHTSITYASHLHDPVYAHQAELGTTDAHCNAMCYPPRRVAALGLLRRILDATRMQHRDSRAPAVGHAWIFVGSTKQRDKAGHYSSCDP